jgi:hypothetical protein
MLEWCSGKHFGPYTGYPIQCHIANKECCANIWDHVMKTGNLGAAERLFEQRIVINLVDITRYYNTPNNVRLGVNSNYWKIVIIMLQQRNYRMGPFCRYSIKLFESDESNMVLTNYVMMHSNYNVKEITMFVRNMRLQGRGEYIDSFNNAIKYRVKTILNLPRVLSNLILGYIIF